jgi:hypothetical protein
VIYRAFCPPFSRGRSTLNAKLEMSRPLPVSPAHTRPAARAYRRACSRVFNQTVAASRNVLFLAPGICPIRFAIGTPERGTAPRSEMVTAFDRCRRANATRLRHRAFFARPGCSRPGRYSRPSRSGRRTSGTDCSPSSVSFVGERQFGPLRMDAVCQEALSPPRSAILKESSAVFASQQDEGSHRVVRWRNR